MALTPYPYPAPHQQHPQYVHAQHAAAPPAAYQSRRVVRHESDEDVPIHESEVDTAIADLTREPYAEMTIEAAARYAHGSGPTQAQVEARHTPQAEPPRRKVEFAKVHPSLRHVLAEVEVDDELDVPTFLRRAND